jgi:ribosomal-protein-alanine N-acetyltransferase
LSPKPSYSRPFDKVITTERVILRPFTLEDVEPAYLMNLDPEVTKYTNDGGVKTREEIHDTILNNVLGNYEKYGFDRFALEDRSTGEFIGFSGLKYMPEFDFVDLGYRLRKDSWGKGIATETAIASLDFGFYQLNLETIYGWVMPDHDASIRIMLKLGFELEKQILEFGLPVNQYILHKSDYQKT